MFERCTAQFKRALFFAELEVWHRNEEFISTRDVLVGLTWEASSRADRIASLKSQAVALRAAVEIPHRPTTATPYFQEDHKLVPLDDDCKKCVAYARLEADDDGEYWIDSDHLLRGMLRVPSKGETALQEFGITLNKMRIASVMDRKEHPPNPAPTWGRVKLFLCRERSSWLFIPFAIVAISLMGIVEWLLLATDRM